MFVSLLSSLCRIAAPALIVGAAVVHSDAQVVVSLEAAGAATGTTTPALEDPFAKPEGSTWMRGGTARLVVGYTDNVLWSAEAEEGRGFAQTELEAFLWRPQRERWDARLLVSGQVRRYADPLAEARGEQSWIVRGEFAVTPQPWLRIALVPQAYYMDQVYDLSPDIGHRFVAKMRVRGASGILYSRITLPRGWEIEPSVQERGTDYYDFSEDYSESKTGVRIRWRNEARFEAGVAIYDHRRAYRDRVNYTAGGRALPGTELRFHQTAVEANVSWTRQWHGRWSVSPAWAYVENRDRAFGFFDYDQRRMRLDAGWEGERWRVELEASAGRYDYRVQTVDVGIAPPARMREDFTFGVTIDYTFNSRWTVLARHGWERSRTNESHASYRINSVSSGIAWSF